VLPDAKSTLRYSLNGGVGDVVTLQLVALNSAEFDPALAVYDPQNKLIAQNDDSLDEKFGISNARIRELTLTEAGRYTIEVASGNGKSGGDFSLQVTGKRGAPGLVTMGAQSRYPGQLTADLSTIQYEFNGSAGEVLTFEVRADTGSRLAPRLQLFDPFDGVLQTVTPAVRTPTTLNLRRFLVPADGVYTLKIDAATLDGAANIQPTGKFTLTRTSELTAILIKPGEPLTGSLDEKQPTEKYVFSALPGQTATITMKSGQGTLDPALLLQILDGNRQIAVNDNATGTDFKRGDAQINKIKLTAGGIYVITARRSGTATGSNTGAYTLTLDLN
jgi:hypothetical protein